MTNYAKPTAWKALGSLADFDYGRRSVRHIAVAERTLLGGRISKIEAERATFDRVTLQSVLIEHCVLASSDWTDCTHGDLISRVGTVGRFHGQVINAQPTTMSTASTTTYHGHGPRKSSRE